MLFGDLCANAIRTDASESNFITNEKKIRNKRVSTNLCIIYTRFHQFNVTVLDVTESAVIYLISSTVLCSNRLPQIQIHGKTEPPEIFKKKKFKLCEN